MPDIAVTLILSDGSEASTRVPTNRHGQLPAVIVDPRDHLGRVLNGTWIGESRDRQMDGITYEPVQVTSTGFAPRQEGPGV
jgi:hypothetical protein